MAVSRDQLKFAYSTVDHLVGEKLNLHAYFMHIECGYDFNSTFNCVNGFLVCD